MKVMHLDNLDKMGLGNTTCSMAHWKLMCLLEMPNFTTVTI